MAADDTVTWGQLRVETEGRLRGAGITGAPVEARRLIEEASGFEGAELAMGLDTPATIRRVAHLDQMVERRLAGEPLQYVLGSWGFRTLDLMVDRRVLIPRPETEAVVGHALIELDRLRGLIGPRPLTVVDLGTGSGAVALSIAAERHDVRVWASDVSAEAIDVAGANLAGLGRPARHVRLVAGSWFEALPDELRGTVDLVISNPPYVGSDEDLPSEVADWEPALALRAGPAGRDALDHLVTVAPDWLSRPGVLVVELAPAQAATMAATAREVGYSEVDVAQDLGGRDRALIARIS